MGFDDRIKLKFRHAIYDSGDGFCLFIWNKIIVSTCVCLVQLNSEMLFHRSCISRVCDNRRAFVYVCTDLKTVYMLSNIPSRSNKIFFQIWLINLSRKQRNIYHGLILLRIETVWHCYVCAYAVWDRLMWQMFYHIHRSYGFSTRNSPNRGYFGNRLSSMSFL